MQNDFYRVGKIVNTHGIRGELKVQATTDFPEERFKVKNILYIRKSNEYISKKIESARKHKGLWLIKLSDIIDLTAAETYKNMELFISDAELQELPSNEYYYKDIIGIKIEDINFGDLGTVTEILALGPNDVWTVNGARGEILIPIIEGIVKEIDLKNRIATIDLPKGLLDES